MIHAIVKALIDPLNFTFFAGMMILTMFALRDMFRKRAEGKVSDVDSYCSSLTALGILGTFLGIFLGLLEFDTSNIKSSTPLLLNGLKTAFLTSIVGLICSVILKKINMIVSAKSVEVQREDYGKIFLEISSDLKTLVQVMGKDAESSMLGQLKLLRMEQGDYSRKLVDSFDRFADKMADNNSKSLIEALENVMRDFNAKINEQFGENFKHLNAGVERLVLWQQNYLLQIESSDSALKTAVEVYRNSTSTIESASSQMQNISNLSKSFDELGNRLEKTLNSNLKINDLMKTTLDALAEVGDRAKQTIPALNKNLQDLTENLKLEVTASIQKTSSLIKLQEDHYQEVFGVVKDGFQRSQTQMDDFLRKTTEDASKSMQKLNVEQEQAMKRKIDALDEALGRELETSLKVMGKNMANLSEKFAKDYSPLTDELRKIVEISKGVRAS